MTYKFPEVDGSRGAPMGRDSFGEAKLQANNSVRLFKVDLPYDGVYDNGGAYWGAGQQLWCALSEVAEYRDFIRANTRREAMVELGLTRYQLISKKGLF